MNLNQESKKVQVTGSGLLVATSFPNAAKVYVDGKLATATDNTLNLPPGWHEIKILKDGYLPWQKKMQLLPEVVAKTDAQLFPQAAELRPLTTTGVEKIEISPDNTKLLITIPTSNIPLQNPASSITLPTSDYLLDLSSATSRLPFGGNGGSKPLTEIAKLELRETWDKQREQLLEESLKTLKPDMRKFASSSMEIVSFSPDDSKILYTPKADAEISSMINPPIIGGNSTAEARRITKGKLYVYDIKEDRNYELPVSNFPLQNPASSISLPASIYWLSSNRHLVYIEDRKIVITEYDGQNKTIVYSGPFDGKFLLPHPDGSKLIILTNFNSSSLPLNLYSLSLR